MYSSDEIMKHIFDHICFSQRDTRRKSWRIKSSLFHQICRLLNLIIARSWATEYYLQEPVAARSFISFLFSSHFRSVRRTALCVHTESVCCCCLRLPEGKYKSRLGARHDKSETMMRTIFGVDAAATASAAAAAFL